MHRTIAPGLGVRTGGDSRSQLGVTYRQRGAKAQPGGRWARLGGLPGMVSSTCPRIAPRTLEDNNPAVYGCRAARSTSRALPVSTKRPAYITAIRSETSA